MRGVLHLHQEKKVWKTGLLQHKIPFSSDLLKTELCDLVKLHKTRQKRYVLDDVLSAQGLTVFRLPPYHPNFNAIENIWGNVKQWLGQHSVTFKLDDVS
jgi:transposase